MRILTLTTLIVGAAVTFIIIVLLWRAGLFEILSQLGGAALTFCIGLVTTLFVGRLLR